MNKFLYNRRTLLLCLLVTLATFAVYWDVSRNEFINFDDNTYITENTHVQGGFTQENILWAFTTGYESTWQPLTWMSHMLDYQLFGMDSAGHHLASLFFHVATSVLLFLLFHRMTGRLWESLFVGAIFALHPLHVESVAWAAERKDVLSAFFWMLTMWAYVRYVEKQNRQWYLLSLLLFALGLMTKPMLVTLPFVLLLMDYWPLKRLEIRQKGKQKEGKEKKEVNRKERIFSLIKEKIPFLCLALISSVITFFVQRTGGALTSWDILPLDIRLGNAVEAFVLYVVKTIWPSGLAIFYPYSADTIVAWKIIIAGIVLILITVAALWSVRRRPYLMVGWLWYVGTLVPVIGIVQFGGQSMADRFMYLPMIGLTIMVSWSVSELVHGGNVKRAFVSAAAIAAIALASTMTLAQVKYWRNNITLFEHALEVTTRNYIAHNNLGYALAKEGKISEAIGHYTEALKVRPRYAEAHNNIANALYYEGKVPEAVNHYTEALRVNPNSWIIHFNMASALADQGKIDDARTHYTETIRLRPDYIDAHNNLGAILQNQGKPADAMVEFNEVLRLDPGNVEAHYNLGVALNNSGKSMEAIDQYNETLRLNPDFIYARLSLAATLKSMGRTKEAIAQYNAILKLKPNDAQTHNDLGAALYSEGNVEEAISHYNEALRIDPNYAEARENLNIALSPQNGKRKP